MSDTEDNKPQEQPKETAMLGADTPSFEAPPQASPRDTSNWDNKVSIDPNGERNIRSDESYKPEE